MQVGQLPEFGRLSECGKKENQWRCWVPPAIRKVPAPLCGIVVGIRRCANASEE